MGKVEAGKLLQPRQRMLKPSVNLSNIEKALDSGYVFNKELTFSDGLELGCVRERSSEDGLIFAQERDIHLYLSRLFTV